MESLVYNQSGKEAGKINLPKEIFGVPWNASLVHQVIVSLASRARVPLAHTKTRGEVSGTGKKPWKQKGTGRARHGSRRSPIWRTGGITFGPRNDKNFFKKVNKKMNIKAFFTILSAKTKDNEILFIQELKTENGKAREAHAILNSLGTIDGFERLATQRERGGKTFISLTQKNENIGKSFKNFKNIKISQLNSLNAVDLLNFKYIIFVNPQESIAILDKKRNKL